MRGLLPGLLGALMVASSVVAGPIDMGEPFPKVELPAPLEAQQREYLGLTDDQPFTLDQVAGKVVLVEVMNVLCPHCERQTGPYNQLYKMIESDPAMRGKVKMLGVAVANSDEQIDDFALIYGVRFPIVPDRSFALHEAIRGGPTPFSIYVLRDQPGDVGVVAGTHLGEDREMDSLFEYFAYLLTTDMAEFALPESELPTVATALVPPQSDAELETLVRSSFAAQGDAMEDFRRLELDSGRHVFTASVVRDGERQPLFAEITSRSAICDVCHDVHFFYVFDRQGMILAFEPLHLTKYGNVEWNEAEVAGFARRVLGRPLVAGWNFDPQTDAVSSATMTSAIIFNSLDRGEELLEELREQGRL